MNIFSNQVLPSWNRPTFVSGREDSSNDWMVW
jgi:hypothetical protein